MRVDATTESLLSPKKKALLLVVTFLESYGKEKLDKVKLFKKAFKGNSSKEFKTIFPWIYFSYEFLNYFLKVRYFLDPNFKWVDLTHWFSGSKLTYAPGMDGENKSWYQEILQNYPVFILYLTFKILEM